MLQKRSSDHLARIAGPIARIVDLQQADGTIPWFENGPWDSWNHAECVMALTVAGQFDAARAGLDALRQLQRADGGFLSEYGNALPMADHVSIARIKGDEVLDTNFSAYVATAVEHFRRVCGDLAARAYWPMVRAAIEHVLTYQQDHGDISWSAEAHGTAIDDSLLAGNASILSSLGHAINLGDALGEDQPGWHVSHQKLRAALRDRPERFSRSGQDRGSHAMDWYYPVLAGIYDRHAGRAHLASQWAQFVDSGLGCRCVADQPWITVAETCELVMAALRCGMEAEALTLLDWIEARRDADGVFWMGWQFVEQIDWPAERPSWTQAAYVLALDATENISPASKIFAN